MEICEVTGWNALEMADSVMKNAKAITNRSNRETKALSFHAPMIT